MAAGTAYAKRFAGGFADNAGGGTPIDSAFLNAVETALLQLIGAAPTADGQVAQWDNANTRFGPALLLNKNVDPAAAIASSKIDFTGANGLTNAAIAGAAAIARSKLNFGSGLVDADIAAAAALGIAKLAGYPADGTKFLAGDATWKTAGATILRKTTAVTVNTTVAETDLLGGAITIAANPGTSALIRLTAWGDWKQNSGVSAAPPRFKLKLGATTLLDTNVLSVASAGNSASRTGWKVIAEILNLGAANSQWANLWGYLTYAAAGTGGGAAAFTTGEGLYTSPTDSGGVPFSAVFEGGNTGAVDTTAGQVLALSVINASANANYETKLFGALVEIV